MDFHHPLNHRFSIWDEGEITGGAEHEHAGQVQLKIIRCWYHLYSVHRPTCKS